MRILLIAPRFHTNLYYQVKSLQKDGNKIRVLVLYRGKSEYYKGVEVKQLRMSFLFDFLGKFFSISKRSKLKSSWQLRLEAPSAKGLIEEFNNFEPDFLILKAYQNNLAQIVLRVAKKIGLKTIVLTQTKKNHIFGSEFLFRKYIDWIKSKGVVAFISPIRETQEVFRKVRKKAFYLPFIYPINNFKKEWFAENKINLISVGKFVPRKDQLALLNAVKDLRGNFAIKLVLIGEKADDFYYSEIESYIKDNNLSDVVEIRSNVEYSKMENEYKAGDLFVLPSYAEPAAYSIVEAMASKLPVVCSSDCGTRCYVKEGVNGYIFKARDTSDLRDKIYMIIKERSITKKMGYKSYELAKKHHSGESFLRKINELIEMRCLR